MKTITISNGLLVPTDDLLISSVIHQCNLIKSILISEGLTVDTYSGVVIPVSKGVTRVRADMSLSGDLTVKNISILLSKVLDESGVRGSDSDSSIILFINSNSVIYRVQVIDTWDVINLIKSYKV